MHNLPLDAASGTQRVVVSSTSKWARLIWHCLNFLDTDSDRYLYEGNLIGVSSSCLYLLPMLLVLSSSCYGLNQFPMNRLEYPLNAKI